MLTRVPRRTEDRGFTLLELVVAMAIAGLLAGMVSIIFTRGFVVARKVQDHVVVVTDVQYALDGMSKDVRTADPVTVAEARRLSVTVKRGGACTVTTYSAVAGTTSVPGYASTGFLLRQERTSCAAPSASPATRVLVPAVPATGAIFTYWTRDGVELSAPVTSAQLPLIARIGVAVAGVPAGNGKTQTVETQIGVRNVQG